MNEWFLKGYYLTKLAYRKRIEAILYNDKGKILVGKRPYGYVLPGGGVDEGESKAEAARREALEEAGYSSDSFNVLKNIQTKYTRPDVPKDSPKYKNQSYFAFGKANLKDDAVLGKDNDNFSNLKWVDPDVLISSYKKYVQRKDFEPYLEGLYKDRIRAIEEVKRRL